MFLELAALCLIVFLLYRLLSNFWTVSRLADKPVLVTGCDSGFGHMLAIRLVESGIPTFAGCLTEKGESELRRVTEGAPGKLWTFPLDVSKDDSVKAAYELVKAQLGPGKGIWGLVNNAGIMGQLGPSDWLNARDYEKVLEVNTLGVIRVTGAFKNLLKMTKGRVVITTSIFGRFCIPGLGPYCVSKFATEAVADTLRLEWKCFGVSVHIIEPGAHTTGMTNSKAIVSAFSDSWHRLNDDNIRNEYGQEYFEACADVLGKEFGSVCAHPMRVVDAYYHALTSRLPKCRYIVGLDAMFLYLPMALLPTIVGDTFYKIALKVRNVPLPRCLEEKKNKAE